MRIGIEAFRIFRKHKHGIDIVALELIKQLQILDKDNEYFIFTFDDNDDSMLYETENFQIVRIPRIPIPIAEQCLLPLLSLKYRLDILHSTGNTSPLFNFCTRIITIHDIIYLEKERSYIGATTYQKIGNLYRRLIVPRVINRSKRIITVSEYEKNRIVALYPHLENRISIIPNSIGSHFCIKPHETTLNTTARYKLPREGYIFLHGNTDPKKNLNRILKALWIIKCKGLLKHKIVISDIARFRIQNRLNKLGISDLENDIILTNYISNVDLPDVYNLAKVVVYTSIRESFGIPILEALACGATVVTSNATAMPETAGRAAILADPYSEEDIAKKIQQALTDEILVDNLKIFAIDQVKKFSWNKSAKLVLGIYDTRKVEGYSPSTVQY